MATPWLMRKSLAALRALGAEREVVFRRADVVAVAFDLDPRFRVGSSATAQRFFSRLARASGTELDAIKLIIDSLRAPPRAESSRAMPRAAIVFHRGRRARLRASVRIPLRTPAVEKSLRLRVGGSTRRRAAATRETSDGGAARVQGETRFKEQIMVILG